MESIKDSFLGLIKAHSPCPIDFLLDDVQEQRWAAHQIAMDEKEAKLALNDLVRDGYVDIGLSGDVVVFELPSKDKT